MRTFESWLAQFRQSIATFAYYEDFGKVIQQAKRHKAELHLMNSLVGEQDIERSFRELVAAYPSVLKCIPEILAVREVEIFGRDEDQSCGKWYVFNGADNENTVDEYCEFMTKYAEADSTSQISMLGDYTELLTKYTETMEEMDNMDTDSLNDAELKYYIEVTTRIQEKLLKVSVDIGG